MHPDTHIPPAQAEARLIARRSTDQPHHTAVIIALEALNHGDWIKQGMAKAKNALAQAEFTERFIDQLVMTIGVHFEPEDCAESEAEDLRNG